MESKIFKYKLDFYYQQAVIYLATLIVYAGIKGSFVEDRFNLVFMDPILYIIIFFVIVSLVVLLLNVWRNRRLIVTENEIIVETRNRKQILPISDIEWIHIGKERFVQTAGRFQVIAIKFRNRPFTFRIRVGRYEHERELVAAMEQIAKKVPEKKRIRFGKWNRRAKV